MNPFLMPPSHSSPAVAPSLMTVPDSVVDSSPIVLGLASSLGTELMLNKYSVELLGGETIEIRPLKGFEPGKMASMCVCAHVCTYAQVHMCSHAKISLPPPWNTFLNERLSSSLATRATMPAMDPLSLLLASAVQHMALSVPVGTPTFGTQHKELTLYPMAPNLEPISATTAENLSLGPQLTKASSVKVEGRKGEEERGSVPGSQC